MSKNHDYWAPFDGWDDRALAAAYDDAGTTDRLLRDLDWRRIGWEAMKVVYVLWALAVFAYWLTTMTEVG